MMWIQPTLASEGSEASDYAVFTSRQEAIRWVEVNLTGGSPPLLPAEDERYERPQAWASLLWRAYQKLFPHLKEIPAPFVVLIDVSSPLGHVEFDVKTALIPNLVILSSFVAGEGYSEIALYGLLAHELSHLARKHPKPGIAERTQRFYWADSDDEPLGFQQPDQQSARSVYRLWEAYSKPIGAVDIEALGAFPLQSVRYGWLSRLWDYLVRRRFEAGELACEKSMEKKIQILTKLADKYSTAFDTFLLDTLDREQLKVGALEVSSLTRVCLNGEKWELRPILERLGYKLTGGSDQSSVDPRDVERIEGFGSTLEGLQFLTIQKLSQRKELRLENLRIFSYEEEADDDSVRVLSKLGLEPKAVTRFVSSLLSYAERSRCERALQLEIAPSYGSLENLHHSNCYRIYHVNRMADLFR